MTPDLGIFQKFGRLKVHEFGAWTCRVGPAERNDTGTGSVACSSEATGALSETPQNR